MIDSTGEEGRGRARPQEEVINVDHYSEGNVGNRNDSNADVNRNDRIPRGEYSEFYGQYLYSLLPAIYQEYDTKENNVLREFLNIIATQAAAIRQDTDNLLKNFFIGSCDEWVIPYIADLIAAKVVPNSSLNSRLDVQNTMRWRKAKGTLAGIVDLIRNTVNGNAEVKEAFRYCSSFPHLAFGTTDIVVNKPRSFVNLHDQDALSNIDTEKDTMPHLVDVREPTQSNGWYNLKNILIFIPQLNIYHVRQVQVEKEEGGLKYYFSNIARRQPSSPQALSSLSSTINYFPIYDLDRGVRIRGTIFAQNPYKYFGKKIGMSVKINNILAACPSPPAFSPIEPKDNPQENRVTIRTETKESSYGDQPRSDYDDTTTNNAADPDFVSLHKAEGIRILEPRNFRGQKRRFIVRLYCYSQEQGAVELAKYNTSEMSYHLTLPPRSNLKKPSAFGTILVSLELDSRLNPSEFPETVIALRDSRKKILVKDSITSKYRNALYVYLPSILLEYGERKYFFVDTDGSTYEVQMINGRYDVSHAQLGRLSASSPIYPPRQLTYSLQPLHNFVELNRFNGIKAVDAKKYGKESFQIEAIAINSHEGQAWKIGRLEVKAGSSKYVNEKEIWIQWRIILGYPEDPKLKGHPPRIYREHYLPACHFKATRLALDENFAELPEKKIEEIVNKEILPEYALDGKIYTVSIDQKKKAYKASSNNNDDDDDNGDVDDNTAEYEVKIIISPEHYEQFEYLINDIKNTIEKKPEFVNEGKLMLRISKPTKASRGEFPLSEIVLTNSSSRSVLVYLPQLKFDKKNLDKNLYVADDGSTSNEEDLLEPARMSAGQVMPIAKKYPLQQRIPVYLNLADWQSVSSDTVRSGELAIDPEHGRFAFSTEDDITGDSSDNKDDDDADAVAAPSMHNITADYNYAFSHDVGAGAYDRRDSLKKATKWVSKNRHSSNNDAFPSRTFETIGAALASAQDEDVIQIEDSAIYKEDNNIRNMILPQGVKHVTLQAANWTMPVIKLTDRFELDFSRHTVKRVNLNGMLITGGPLILRGNFDKLDLVSCTIDPGYDGERYLGLRIEEMRDQKEEEQTAKKKKVDHATTLVTNPNIGYAMENKSNPSLKDISLSKSISGGILIDDYVSTMIVEDSIIDNLSGSAIYTTENKKREKNPFLKLEVRRSNILSDYQDPYILELEDICCIDSILTNKVKVSVKEKSQNDINGNNNSDDYYSNNNNGNSCTSFRCSRYEEGSTFEKVREHNNVIVNFAENCISDRPIFVSTTFGNPAYLHLHHLSSKSILERAENTLEMGAFNKNYKPLRVRNLTLRLREFLPLGIKSGVIYVY